LAYQPFPDLKYIIFLIAGLDQINKLDRLIA